MNKSKRVIKALRKLDKSRIKLEKARKERIWIEENPHINLLNYPYYKLKRVLFKEQEKCKN